MIIPSLRPFDDGRGDQGTGMGAIIDDFNSIFFCQTQSGAHSIGILKKELHILHCAVDFIAMKSYYIALLIKVSTFQKLNI